LNTINGFIKRQHMKNGDYEIFHSLDIDIKNFDYHHHDFYEVYFFIGGNVSYVIEGKKYPLMPGDIILLSPYELHQVINHDETVHYERFVLWMNETMIRSLSDETTDLGRCFDSKAENFRRLIRLSKSRYTSLLSSFDRLCDIFYGESFGKELMQRALLTQLLIEINELLDQQDYNDADLDITHNDFIINILNYITKNLTGDLSLQRISDHFYISQYHLCREFKKNMGISIHKYVIGKRLALSKQLIEKGHSFSSAAAGSGFVDYTGFYRSFVKQYKMNPKEYAKNIKINPGNS